MRPHSIRKITAVACSLAAALLSGPSLADKPEWAGGGKASKHQMQEQQQEPAYEARGPRHFDDRQRAIVHDYYARQFRAGHCPPGLARKNAGCMPPGQARKWAIGQPLPRDLAYESLPPTVTVQLGTPPAGYRYVRIASDILLIAVGTGMVVDAIKDLGQR